MVAVLLPASGLSRPRGTHRPGNRGYVNLVPMRDKSGLAAPLDVDVMDSAVLIIATRSLGRSLGESEVAMKKSLRGRHAALGDACCLWARQPAAAADPIKLRVADSFPAEHFLVRIMLKTVDGGGDTAHGRRGRRSSIIPNQQLGKAADLLRLTQTGGGGYRLCRARLCLRQDAAVRGGAAARPVRHSLPGHVGLLEIRPDRRAGQGRLLAPNRLHLLLTTVLPPYRAFTVRTHGQRVWATSPGLKLRTAGGAQDLTARSLGSVSGAHGGPRCL